MLTPNQAKIQNAIANFTLQAIVNPKLISDANLTPYQWYVFKTSGLQGKVINKKSFKQAQNKIHLWLST